ncbi:putative UDP-glucose dehydrogenase Ugd1 [Aspergillus vadensis CBS 113365]|uniref:UDP-glucose 6-dehydrogenase n=1 Tax=Aspergillus vadensis (strain CBS 113365 / IMI 142717 / IBT 24658) TaxID=1448311 RepID=A0A319B831_ASPVC|nr:UDP-glucose dehydrogenase Ugd1 [Aspergillus vadensis CBS 113365]PYH68695.1 UDP-glucose dehydrogenase Ugd1 [Aspergillus vadensis CBS 113365]
MMPFFPLLFVLASITLFFSRRRYKTIESAEPPVVVKGHTYSDSVDETELQPLESKKVEDVRSACIIGAGHVGALTAVVLASQNPHIQFSVVDNDADLINAWNSDRPPVFEPGLEEMLFEEISSLSLDASAVPNQSIASDSGQPRKRKLTNLTFSTNIHAGVAAADLIFLCSEISSTITIDEKERLDLSQLESAIRAIAQVSTGHKIIVQKSTAPCGVVQRMKKILRKTASPSASFDVLSNPDFLVPGTALHDLLYPPRIIIGHIFSEDMSPGALSALKKLYIPWVPEERIITMDAWSSELGKIAANAFLAQQISSLHSLSAICESTNANINHITQTLGLPQRVGFGFGSSHLQTEVLCLVYLARELGLQQVAEYWRAVLRMNDSHNRRISQRVLSQLSGDLTEQKIAILGFTPKENNNQYSVALGLVRDLSRNGVKVGIYDPFIPAGQLENTLRASNASLESVTVAESVEAACAGCSAVILHTDWETFGHEKVRWQGIAGQMQSPKVFLDPYGVFDQFKMQQWGFKMLQVGVRQVEAK